MRPAIKSLAVGAILALSLSTVAMAGPLDDAQAAINRGDAVTAVNIYLPMAEQGNATAQWFLGMVYQRGGGGVAQDYGQAVHWFERASRQGLVFAQVKLSQFYAAGAGVPQDRVQAYMWLTIAQAANADLKDMILASRTPIADQLTAAEIAEGERRAREFRPQPE